ncbi:MAG: PD40 domain-containing protein [Acidobacteria bacterium]|nr:PD40 domain-containing protein [Acidobacteriota bacterium]MCB9399707.1 PD40 domain-containing protein [Acidobacteriota bacterium]
MKNALLVCFFFLPLFAGGKNKVSYDQFEWKVYQSAHFKVFHYTEEEHLLPAVVDMAEAAYAANSDKLQHQINFKIPLVIYKTHEEFEQTNIFGGFVPRYVGAFADPFQSRMVLPIDLPPEDLYELIAHELTHIFQYDMLFNNRISTIIRANAPTWFIEGMASYIANDEDNLGRMVLRDAAVNAGFNSLSNLNSLSYMAYRVGHAAFDFMEEEWGIEGVRNFLWEYRKDITGGVDDALQKAFELEPNEFNRKFKKYLRKRYIELLPIKEEPDDYAREIRTRRVVTTLSPELSPSGDLFAAVVPMGNELDLVLVSTKDGRIFKNLTKGYTNEYTEINVNAFSGKNDLSWSPDGNEIAFSVRKEGTNRILVVNVLNGRITEDLSFDDIRSLESPAFGGNPNELYFTGNKNGAIDVFYYNRKAATVVNLTNDPQEDRNPRISPDGNELLYSSMRAGFMKIIAYNLEKREKTQLTSGLGNDIQANYSQDMKRIYFSSDRYDDIYNIYSLEIETGLMHQYTNLLTGAFSPQERILFDHKAGVETKQLVFSAFYEGRYRIYRMDKPSDREKVYSADQDNYENVKDHPMTANTKVEPESFGEYRPFKNFSVSGVDLTAGVTDDGRFLTNSSISFSDVLGNHNLDISAYSISSYESYYANYLNRTGRAQWGLTFDSQQYFFVDYYFQPGSRIDRTYKNMILAGYWRYPFSLFSRVDIGAGGVDYDSYYPRYNEELDRFLYEVADYTEPFAYLNFSRDTARYSYFGPIQGMVLDIGATHTFNQYTTYRADYKGYKELSRRSLFATRVRADYSDGDRPELFFLGGNSNLRGDYFYNQFAGTKRLLTQMELRFPLVDQITFPGFSLGNIRGRFFTEVGGAWFDDDSFNFEFEGSDTYFPELPNPNYLLGSYGFEISMFFLGLELHWTWSTRTNFDDLTGSRHFSFWIGRTIW